MIPALASMGPSPHAMAVVAIAPLAIVLVTALAGGYGVLRAKAEAAGKSPGRWFPWILAAFGLSFCSIGADTGAFAGLVFAFVALLRALELASFAARALAPRERRAAWLEGRGPLRLGLGALLALAAACGIGVGTVELSSWNPMPYRFQRELREMVAWELAHARVHAPRGEPPFVQPLPSGPAETATSLVLGDPHLGGRYASFHPAAARAPGGYMRSYALDFRLGADGRTFTAEVYPTRFPAPPFDRLVSLPTFRADETGRIRAVETSTAGARCPPDAPVVDEVKADERAEAELRRLAEGAAPEAPTPAAGASSPAPASPTRAAAPR